MMRALTKSSDRSTLQERAFDLWCHFMFGSHHCARVVSGTRIGGATWSMCGCRSVPRHPDDAASHWPSRAITSHHFQRLILLRKHRFMAEGCLSSSLLCQINYKNQLSSKAYHWCKCTCCCAPRIGSSNRKKSVEEANY